VGMWESRVRCEISKSCGNRSLVSMGRHFHSVFAVVVITRAFGGCYTLAGCPVVVPSASYAVVLIGRSLPLAISPESGVAHASLRPGLIPPTPMPRGRKPARLPIDAAEFHVHKAHGPIAAFGFHQPHGLAADRFTHKDHLALPPDLPGLFDTAHLVRGVVPRLREARRVGAGRRHIVARGRGLPERFMRTLRVEFTP